MPSCFRRCCGPCVHHQGLWRGGLFSLGLEGGERPHHWDLRGPAWSEMSQVEPNWQDLVWKYLPSVGVES